MGERYRAQDTVRRPGGAPGVERLARHATEPTDRLRQGSGADAHACHRMSGPRPRWSLAEGSEWATRWATAGGDPHRAGPRGADLVAARPVRLPCRLPSGVRVRLHDDMLRPAARLRVINLGILPQPGVTSVAAFSHLSPEHVPSRGGPTRSGPAWGRSQPAAATQSPPTGTTPHHAAVTQPRSHG